MAHAVSINARAGTANRCRIARRNGFSTTKVFIVFRNSKKQPCHARNIMPAARSVRRACDSPKDGNDPDTDRPPALYKGRSEEHTSELQSLMRISYAVFCLKKNKYTNKTNKKKKHAK